MAIVRFLVNGKEIQALEAKVKRDHDRSVDTAEITVGANYDINKKDKITYIQDVVDVDYLTAIYNFHYSARDEGGYDIDGDDGTYTAGFTEDIFRKYTKSIQPVINFNADNEKVTIADNSRIDFSKQFDIIVITSAFAAFPTARTVFSKSNGGIGGGIEIGVSGTDPGYIDVELMDTDGILTQITGTNINLRDGEYHFLRVKRDENDLVTVSVDGIIEGTATKSASSDDYTASGVDVIVGKNFSAGSKHYRGNVAQIRIYSGSYLSDDDFTTLLNSKRQPLTMKFRGTVSNVENNNGVKKIFSKGINDGLNSVKITKTLMDARDDSADNNGIDNIFLDDATNRMRTETIVKKILEQVDSEYIFFNAENDGNIMNRYVARGSLIGIVKKLFILDNRNFWITPRKVIIKENQPITTKYSILEDQYNTSISVEDDNRLLNDVEGVGEIQLHRTSKTFSGDGATTEFSLGNTPVTVKVEVDGTEKIRGIDSSDSISKDYYIEHTDGVSSGARLIFFSAPASGTNNIAVDYTFEATGTLYFRHSDATSIANNGRVSGRVYLSGFDQGQIATFLNNLVKDTKDIKKRIKVIAPKLVNFMREGLECDVVNEIKSIDSLFTLKSMEWHYPKGQTIMNFGEHDFNFFDILKVNNENISELGNTFVKTNNI